MKKLNILKFSFFAITLFTLNGGIVFAQQIDNSKAYTQFSAVTTITNNGISIIPTFSLGKPAGIVEMAVGKRFTFEPQFRFSLEGKPWSVILWGRYKLLKKERFNLNIGAHPAIAFKTTTNTIDGVTKEIITSHRYLAAEIAPSYTIKKNVSVGLYYLYSRGLEESANKNNHFLTLNSNFSNIKLTDNYFLKFNPQIYYLNIDNEDGLYCSSGLTLASKKSPFSIQTFVNKTIKTDIIASKDLVMNLSLLYTFNKKYMLVK